jgi:hypothetical protein
MKKILIVVALALLACNFIGPRNNYEKQIEEVKRTAKNRGLNSNYCILIDFSQYSGERRMHITNLKTGRVEKSFPVAQGRGKSNFSNIPGSNSSSEGMAVTSERGGSMYGTGFKYVLDGLDSTNSAIRRRSVVMHSWGGIPFFGIFPLPLYQSKGCPTMSNKALLMIDKLIKNQTNKKIIVYTFE